MADSKGISIHLGLNAVDPAHYGGWNGKLTACEFDAKDMKAIAEARGFDSTILLTNEATTKNFLTAMGNAASQLNEGDILFLTYSGHGGQVPDLNGDEAENARPDGKDETWALYDRQVVDDELYAQWATLRSGVRVIMLSDSCHSGTVAREMAFPAMVRATVVPGEVVEPTSDVTRLIPLDIRTVLDSVGRTSRLVIVEENPYQGGWGGTVASIVADEGFESLDAPIRRVAAACVPLPFADSLEQIVLPTVDKVAAEVRRLAAY